MSIIEHRHIRTDHLADADFGSVAAIRSVLERGDYADVRALYRRVWHAPHGALADRALAAAAKTRVYGRPLTLRRLIEHRRSMGQHG